MVNYSKMTDQERIKNFRLMDDDFMSKVFDKNIPATQLILNIILGRTDVEVISVDAQREFKTVYGHSVRFDIFAKDKSNKPYDIEVQRADKGAAPQRARYNNAVLDSNVLKKGVDYPELVETYVIFITERDVFEEGLPIYRIERVNLGTGKLFNDGSHIIFVNGEYKNNDTDIGKLMHDFRCKDSEDMYFSELADKVKYFKETEGGNETMCKMMEDMRKEVAKETAMDTKREMVIELLRSDVEMDKIVKCSGLSLEEVEKLKKENNL